MKKIFVYIVFTLTICNLYSWPGTSGTGGPGFDGGSGTNNNHSGTSGTENMDTPVDGGIFTMTALAIGYGVRQARKRKEDKNNENGAV